MTDPLPSGEEIKELRHRLLVTARAKAVPDADVEDLTQEALFRVIKDDRPSELPFASRAKRKLLDVTAEHFRNPQRAFLASAERLEEQDALAQEDAALAMINLQGLINQIGGDDVLAFARLRALKVPEREMAERLDWSPQRVAAARKQFSRKAAAMIAAINESTS
jgi:hypothetical protein